MPELSITSDLIFVLIAALVGGVAANFLKQPPIVGFIFGGILLGPNLIGLVKNSAGISALAEIGVSLLMFTLGVEFSLKKFYGLGRVAVVGTVIQILSSLIFSLIFVVLFGWSLNQGLFFGLLLSLSSTAVVVKILSDKNLLDTVPGQLSSGWLLVQDLAVLPMMLLLPLFSGNDVSLISILFKLLETVLILGLVIYLGVHFVPKFLIKVSRWGRELVFIVIVLLVLLTSFLTSKLGLSFSIGAFLAGLVVTESPMSDEASAQIRSLRNLFLAIFFVTVGMLFNPKLFLASLPLVLVVLLVLFISKFIPIFAWVSSFGYHPKPSFLAAFYLLQVGEFSFVLASLGFAQGLLNQETYNLFLSSALVSLLFTPLFINKSEGAYKIFRNLTGKVLKDLYQRHLPEAQKQPQLKDHVVICGYGRVGRYVSDALKHVGIDQIIVDYNPENLRSASEKGLKTIYGDSSEPEILKAASISEAKALVLAHPDQVSSSLTIYKAKEMNSKLKILARAHKDQDVEDLRESGIHRVIQPEFEASLTFAEKLLDLIGIERKKIESFLTHIRRRSVS